MRQRRSGFTLIELLIVVVIIGVLAAIAIPKFQNTKGKANLAAVKSDLRNLATAEEAYFYTNGTYTSSLASLNVNPSPGVTFMLPLANVDLEPLASQRVPLFVTMDQQQFTADRPLTIRIHARSASGKLAEREVRAVFLGSAR